MAMSILITGGAGFIGGKFMPLKMHQGATTC